MVTKTQKCSYTEYKIVPGRGSRFVGKDGRVHYFISTKARSLFHQKIKPVKLTWTTAWRAYNKKIKVDDIQKKRSRKTTRIQKAVVGMSIEEIRRRKAETREDRDKANDAAAKDIKDRKQKALQAKKSERSKQQKVAGGKAADKAVKNVKGGKGGKR
jgi:large subunit ribosomal protein L24e|mmetsp:Transcript_28263/g.37728  ORF Transcript_28263/g.37728 Transcript_28263/m.37728 type:complete len:157 (-) Transcript_28263:198-668(-)|eukprot:CAMPEP_0185568044 /NCGR_PEP_ID=MMETSP0434-20130131/1115_1 /TAXON_ID=626734 ORGANISM="Favella taraikaensis, Strain Fe Narragansett Bay" /NCGR_SAMPLE_ID=MMETSP0434 /ASSEMBLY_ACC=CAM_ASM_000379 /LENGTH=156 /DNA_ID=CAMNT_0028182425 /DNA_START=61 /DNA_END=531 /DNA_ORIENTATION=-